MRIAFISIGGNWFICMFPKHGHGNMYCAVIKSMIQYRIHQTMQIAIESRVDVCFHQNDLNIQLISDNKENIRIASSFLFFFSCYGNFARIICIKYLHKSQHNSDCQHNVSYKYKNDISMFCLMIVILIRYKRFCHLRQIIS